jgi:hypothetical protein
VPRRRVRDSGSDIRQNSSGSVLQHKLGLRAADRWVTEFILAYDGRPSYSVSVVEFFDGKVAGEPQYFADPFEPEPARARRVERGA